MGSFTATFLAECEAPVINSLTKNVNGYLVINFTMSSSNYASSRYEVATDAAFTSILVYDVGTHTSPVTTTVLADNYSTLYVRVRKYCSLPVTGTYESAWSNIGEWITAPTSSIYVSNVQGVGGSGQRTFDLHVEGAPFVGYACGLMTNSSVNTRQKLASIDTAGAIITLTINSDEILGAEDRESQAVNIPVGIYPGCSINISANAVPMEEDVNVDAALVYSLDNIYENGINSSFVSVDLQVTGTPV